VNVWVRIDEFCSDKVPVRTQRRLARDHLRYIGMIQHSCTLDIPSQRSINGFASLRPAAWGSYGTPWRPLRGALRRLRRGCASGGGTFGAPRTPYGVHYGGCAAAAAALLVHTRQFQSFHK
jgi:hypothetical protein